MGNITIWDRSLWIRIIHHSIHFTIPKISFRREFSVWEFGFQFEPLFWHSIKRPGFDSGTHKSTGKSRHRDVDPNPASCRRSASQSYIMQPQQLLTRSAHRSVLCLIWAMNSFPKKKVEKVQPFSGWGFRTHSKPWAISTNTPSKVPVQKVYLFTFPTFFKNSLSHLGHLITDSTKKTVSPFKRNTICLFNLVVLSLWESLGNPSTSSTLGATKNSIPVVGYIQ